MAEKKIFAAVGEKALVFTQFAEMGQLLRSHLQECFGREVPFLYGGVAKINSDWLRGRPLDEWLADRGDDPMLGFILRQPWAPCFFSYGMGYVS